MEKLTKSLRDNIQSIKGVLAADDILVYSFRAGDGTECAVVYADGLVDKAVIGDLAARPLAELGIRKNPSDDGDRGEMNADTVKDSLLFPEIKEQEDVQELLKEILDGNCLLLADGIAKGFIVGAKKPPVRAVAEPPTDIAVKGPREGFIEDIKTNMALLRKRLKTPMLRFEMSKVGRRSETNVAVCWLKGISDEKIKDKIVKRIGEIDIDYIPDSSYIADFLAPRKHSVFRQIGTTEKPDVFAAKMAEGRVGILVDGSPIALTAPFIFIEDFQSSEDYYVSPFMATIFRAIRFIAVFIALLLPAFYVCSQLFKLQLLPLGLTLTIASSIQGLPLSPSLEMFLVLLVLEVLKEASIRHAQIRGHGVVRGRRAGARAKPRCPRVSYPRPPSSSSPFRASVCTPCPTSSKRQHSALAVFAHRRQHRPLRHRPAGGFSALLSHQRGRLRNAPARPLFAARPARSEGFHRQI